MVTEFETLDVLKSVLKNNENGENIAIVGEDIKKLVALKNKYQHMCDEFDKWADEQAEIEENRLLVES